MYILKNATRVFMKNKCIFLDRDGVLNEDCSDYVYKIEDVAIPTGVIEGLQKLKAAGFLLIVVTNQAGIAKGLYERADVWKCHAYFQEQCGHLLDDLYFCPHHPDYTSRSLLRKPGSLMLEKAIAKYNIDPSQSWMIGDRHRDVEAGQRIGVKTIQITASAQEAIGDYHATNFSEVTTRVMASI